MDELKTPTWVVHGKVKWLHFSSGLESIFIIYLVYARWRRWVCTPFGYLRSDCAFIYLFTYICFLFYTHNVCIDHIRQRNTFGHWTRYTNLFQDTLSTNPTWPLEILRSAEKNNGHLNNRRRNNRRRIKKHRGKRAGIRNRLRKRAHSPPLPSILLTNVQCLENKMDNLRARISFQQDTRDCNILYLSKAWLTTSVPDTAVMPSDNFSVLRMDRTAEAGGGVCFMINKKWCDPRNISILSCSCSSHLEHLPIMPILFVSSRTSTHYAHSICPRSFHRSLLLLFTFHHRQTLAWLCLSFTMCSAATLTNILMLPLSLRGTLTKPTSKGSCRTFINMYPVQLEDRIHWIIATLSFKMPTMPAHYWQLANWTMPPYSSHRNINKGSFRNPRWRG